MCPIFVSLCVARHKPTQNHAEPTAFAVHIFITISSITFNKKSYEKLLFIYHATQLIETNRLVYKTL